MLASSSRDNGSVETPQQKQPLHFSLSPVPEALRVPSHQVQSSSSRPSFVLLVFLLGDACNFAQDGRDARVISCMEPSLVIQGLGLHEASGIVIGFSVANSLENNLWFHLAHDSQREESFCIGGDPSIPGFLKNFIWYRNYVL